MIKIVDLTKEPKGKRTKEEELTRYMEWNFKQSKQRLQTLNQKKVHHDSDRKDQLRKESKTFMEEGNRIKDLIADGK